MPSYDVTFLEERKLTFWAPEGTDDKQKTQLAMDHIAFGTFKGVKSKLLSVEPTPPSADWIPPDLTDDVPKIK